MDPISVRTTRLNNILVGNGVSYKSTSGRMVSVCGNLTNVSASVVEAINREGLLDAFSLLYNECDKDGLKKRDRNIADFVQKFRPIVEETRKLRVNVDDFITKSLIGRGYFGDVHLVVERQTGDVYAMKKIKKSKVTTTQVKEERDIMARRCSEWIIKLQYAFQTQEHLYLVMEFLPGGDLLSLMNRHGPFDEDLARFYLAELTMAIHTLHSIGYVHRDIKPENILIDRFGHLKLADFGNAAALDRDGHVFSMSPVGTPDYIAPELLQTVSSYRVTKAMHDVSCDFWSMGIIGYEMLCETTPFHEENVHETYSKILTHLSQSPITELIVFPSDLRLSVNFTNLIESLVTGPTNRLNYDQICAHAFFLGVKWDSLRSQVPPIIPSVTGEDDTSNFSTTGKTRTFHKKSLTTNIKSNDFNGSDLPYIGYSFVHMEQKQKGSSLEEGALDDARFGKMKGKLKELQLQLKDRVDEVSRLKQELFRAEEMAKQTGSKSKILEDAKAEITKMKNVIIEKTVELTAAKAQIKTLINSLKIEEEMWMKKEATITDLMRMNRQKFEDARIASEIRYEKLLSERKIEFTNVVQKMNACESELKAKTSQCSHLDEKVANYKDIIKQLKQKTESEKSNFEKNKQELTATYEEKLQQLRNDLRSALASNEETQGKMRELREELRDSITSTRTTQEAKNVTEKNNDEILRRLNLEIKQNNHLHTLNVQLDQQLASARDRNEELEKQVVRLERELKVLECGKSLAESQLGGNQESPYETAPGSLTELHLTEDQLRLDLEAAKEEADTQRSRAHRLQEILDKMEDSMTPASPPNPAPRLPRGQEPAAPKTHDGPNKPDPVGEMLEKRSEKLEKQLAAVREEMIVERQAARSALLSQWKTEKQLSEALSEKKMIQRRMELTEERIKKFQGERDEAERLCKIARDEKKASDECIQQLKDEVAALKREVLKEHSMWVKAEQERMKSKSEIIDQIGNVHKLEQHVSELREKLQQNEHRLKSMTAENRGLLQQQQVSQTKNASACDEISKLQIMLKNLQDNYERLKYACTLTDSQLTEMETMLEAEQASNKSHQANIDKLYVNLRDKDGVIGQLKGDLNESRTKQKLAEGRVASLQEALNEQSDHFKELNKKFTAQQQQLIERVNEQFETHERLDALRDETEQMRTAVANNEREIVLLKEENARILSDLFHANAECTRLQEELKAARTSDEELRAEIDELQTLLSEKENFYLQRDIKAETTLTQHKKLIDYLQLKVEDLSQKKKKTLTDMLFGSSQTSSSSSALKKELTHVESSMMYRTLQEELRREKQRCKSLQEQLDKLEVTTTPNTSTVARSPLKVRHSDNQAHEVNASDGGGHFKSPQKRASKMITDSSAGQQHKSTTTMAPLASPKYHRFELTMQENSGGPEGSLCVVCSKAVVLGSPCWKCKLCKSMTHRKCRGSVTSACGEQVDAKRQLMDSSEETDSCDTQSMDKYSYKGQVDEDGPSKANEREADALSVVGANLILKINSPSLGLSADLEVNCAYEVESERILLLGCNFGLYAYHIDQPDRLLHIAGIDSVSCIAVSRQFAKAIMVGANGESLYQCDYRQLQTRCQSNVLNTKGCALEASVLDLPFANRSSSEKWQLLKISNESEDCSENPVDAVAIAATSSRIVILKYDLKIQKFKPVRSLDTATSASSVLFTRHTAIVSSDKFFEIDLDNYMAEEFMDIADKSLTLAQNYQPVVAIRISPHEFLLCFMECGLFVDEFGCRSRPYELHWDLTPTGFHYAEPFLYVAHFQSLQVIRLNRSYTDEASSGDAGDGACMPKYRRAHIPLYMCSILASSGKTDIYVAALERDTGRQHIYRISALDAFKDKSTESLETLSSIGTSVTFGSITTME